MSANKYPNPERTSSTTLAKEILARSQEQFKRAVENVISPEEFDQRPSLAGTFYLATNKEKPKDPILVAQENFNLYELRLVGKVVREISFAKDEGDIAFSVEVAKESIDDRDPRDSVSMDVILSSNPDGAFASGVPVDLAIAMEAPLISAMAADNEPSLKESNILEQLDGVMLDIEHAVVFNRKF